MYNQTWPAELLAISTKYNPVKRRKVSTIKLTLIPNEEMAETMGREVEQALVMVEEQAVSKVTISLPVVDYNLILSHEYGDQVKIRIMDSAQAVVQTGPEMIITVKWGHMTEDAVDLLEFLHRHMGTVEVQMEERQTSMDGAIGEAVDRLKKSVGKDGSVTMEFEGKSTTVVGN